MTARARWRRRSSVAMAVVSLALVTGCGGGGDGAAPARAPAADDTPAAAGGNPRAGIVEFRQAEPGSGDGLKLGYISLGESVPFAHAVTESIRAQATAAGAELVVCDSQLDGQKALDCARTFATQQVDGYLNFQVDQNLAGAICQAGPQVPVIAVDIAQRPCQVSFMGAANTYAGMIAGEAMGKFAKEQWDCDYDAYISLESTASPDASEQRMGGYRQGFAKHCPGELRNERVLDADRTDVARTKVTDTLTALPGADRILVVAINDDGILGALAAARTAGREDDVYVSGQGADESAWCEIATNDHWIADTAYFPERYGEIGIPYLIDAVNGEQVPEQLLIPHELVNRDNLEQFYDVGTC